MTKVCTKCKRVLDCKRFSRQHTARDGLRSACKDCCSEAGKKYYRNPVVREKVLERGRLRPKVPHPVELVNGLLRPLSQSQQDRFWKHVDKVDTESCWLWKAGKDSDGYGKVTINRVTYRSNRVAYFVTTGIDPSGLKVCHTCDNPSCCNPKHLWLGTVAENNADRDSKGRSSGPRGEQNTGHKLTSDQVRLIRASNEAQHVVAKRYGVSRSLISMVRNKVIWGHVT
jgi:hypothetical protein